MSDFGRPGDGDYSLDEVEVVDLMGGDVEEVEVVDLMAGLDGVREDVTRADGELPVATDPFEDVLPPESDLALADLLQVFHRVEFLRARARSLIGKLGFIAVGHDAFGQECEIDLSEDQIVWIMIHVLAHVDSLDLNVESVVQDSPIRLEVDSKESVTVDDKIVLLVASLRLKIQALPWMKEESPEVTVPILVNL